MDNQYKILLDLTVHRYDEVNSRNETVDDKNKSMVAFMGVLLTLEVNAVINVLEFVSKFQCVNCIRILTVVGIISVLCYLISILYFISAVNFVNKFQEAPVLDEVISFIQNEESYDDIIKQNIVNFKKCIEDNHKIIEGKTQKAKEAFKFLKYGILSTVLFIILFILILWG